MLVILVVSLKLRYANPNKVSLMKNMFLITKYLFGLDIGLNWLILVGSVNYWFGSVNVGKD